VLPCRKISETFFNENFNENENFLLTTKKEFYKVNRLNNFSREGL